MMPRIEPHIRWTRLVSQRRATVVCVLGVVLALGATPAAATGSQAASPAPEFTLARDRGVVASFGGYGGQLNQHVYAEISGPPPALATMEARVVALQPQLVRIFFNTSEWTNEDRLESFVRTVELAHRAKADINITWQGSTFDFAMRNMGRFADVLESLLRDGVAGDRIWVTLFNEPNTTQRTLPEYEQVYRLLDRQLRARGVRDRVQFMGGDLIRSTVGASQAEWFRYMARNMGDLLDAWSVHVYWDFWETDKIDERLLREVRTIFAAIPAEQRRPLYITEFGVRGLGTFEGEPSFEPGFWPDGTPMGATTAAAFQQAWFNIRSAQLGYSGTVKWDVYPAKYDAGTQDHSSLGPGAEGWPVRPVYRVLQLMALTTEPRGGSIVELVPTAGADPAKLLTAYVSPASDVTILGLHMDGAAIHDDIQRSRPVQRRRASAQHVLPAARLERRRPRRNRRQGLPRHRRIRSGRVRGAARLRLRVDEHTDHVGAEVNEMSVPTETRERRLTRSELLRRAGVAAAAVAVGSAAPSSAFAGPLRYRGRWLAGDLSVVQWAHFVPRYNAWFRTWAEAWGEQNDVQVTVDLEPYTQLPALAAAEVKAQRGHDIFGFLSPPARYEEQVIDHKAIVSQVEGGVGAYGEIGRRSTYNPKTRKYFGVSDFYVPAPVIWRHDLWNSIGESPASWDHVRAAAPALKALGHPIGIGQANELDSNVALISFLMCFGSFMQDESGALTIGSKNTVEAVQFMADLYAQGSESTVFGWKPESNNQFLLGGKGSLIMNAISAVRRAEDLGMPIAKDLWMWPIPHGPRGRLALGQYTSVYSIWKFAKHREAAEKFVADLCVDTEQATLASNLFNFPSFPGAIAQKQIYETAAADTHLPRGKYSILTTIASKHTRNVGYPGHANAAVQEALDTFLIPRMFAQVSQGRMSAADSVRATAKEMKRIWARQRAAGKI